MEKPMEKHKLSIPDDDLPNWMQVLREGGMTDDEINSIFCKTNKTWLEARLPELIEKELKKINDLKKKQNGIGLIGEEREYFRKAIEQGFREGTRTVNESK
jgi:hypothetical protein